MKIVKNVKEVFSDVIEASNWVKENFKTHLDREKALLIIIGTKKHLGIYCYG
jgi:hypothetical protein